MGSADRVTRIIIVLGVVVLYYFKIIDGTLGFILMIFAAISLLTSLVSFCPLYLPFGINTCKAKK